ncbi:MAG: repeat containing protein [Verrucomicrobiota bacterium]|jgi:outer membrane protein assembly factor BamD
MRKSALYLAIPIVMLHMPQPASAVDIFRLKIFEKKKPSVLPAPTAADETAAKGDVGRVDALVAKGDLKDALKLARSIVAQRGQTSAAARAQFQIGRILEQQQDYEDAFEAYSSYLTNYPRGGDFDAAVKAQFDIAKTFMDGRKKRILGIAIASNHGKAEKMFAEIVKRAPFHRLAPMAQFNVGQALERQGKPSEALAAYQELVIRYPNDAVADDAQYQIGYVQLEEAQRGSYDQNSRQRAKEAFEDFSARYPNSEKIAQARENIKALSSNDVAGSLDAARFYDRAKKYRAAAIYYNDVIRQAPGSKESDIAKKRIDELKGIVGADALRAPSKALSGADALARRQAQSRVDVASRPDFAGPAVELPPLPSGNVPNMRIPVGPAVEPALPTGDPLQGGGAGLIPAADLPPIPEVKPGEKPAGDPAKPEVEKPAPAKEEKPKSE